MLTTLLRSTQSVHFTCNFAVSCIRTREACVKDEGGLCQDLLLTMKLVVILGNGGCILVEVLPVVLQLQIQVRRYVTHRDKERSYLDRDLWDEACEGCRLHHCVQAGSLKPPELVSGTSVIGRQTLPFPCKSCHGREKSNQGS